MHRRLFDHFFAELSVAMGRVAPRVALWMALSDSGADPDFLDRPALTRFLDDGGFDEFLGTHRVSLADAARRRMRRRVLAMDPRHPTPYEHLSRIIGLTEH